jgi:hypothetical protein
VPKKKFDSSIYSIQFDYQMHLGNMRRVAMLPESFIGRTADTDRAVMLALIEWGIANRAYTIHPGVRNIAVEAGKAPTTVSVSIRRLQQKDWLKVVYKPGSFESKAEQIALNWNKDKFLKNEVPEAPSNSVTNQLDIWNGNGLGSNAKVVYQVLLEFPEGKRLVQLKQLTKLSEKQCRTALGKLIEAGLVSKVALTYLDVAPKDEASQIEIVNFIRSKWRVDDKEQARLKRFDNDRQLRKRTLSSPEVLRIKNDKYRNK